MILDINRKLDRERYLIQGALSLKKSTSNPLVQQKCDTSIREAQKNIDYLEESLRHLHIRKRNSITGDFPANEYPSPTSSTQNVNPYTANSQSPGAPSSAGNSTFSLVFSIFFGFVTNVFVQEHLVPKLQTPDQTTRVWT